jgi:hypothetical protein
MNSFVQLNTKYFNAIIGKGVWLNLKRLLDGSIRIFIYNKTGHGHFCNKVELNGSLFS